MFDFSEDLAGILGSNKFDRIFAGYAQEFFDGCNQSLDAGEGDATDALAIDLAKLAFDQIKP